MMEMIYEALAFLIYIIAGGAVAAAILIFFGIYPIKVESVTYVFTQQKSDEVMEELNILVGVTDEDENV